MFDFVHGTIVDLTPTQAILQVGQIGVCLQISLNTHDVIKGKKETKLFTHLYVRNEGQNVSGFDLYGFATEEERLYFSTIISVSGIGASTGRLMISAMKPAEIAQAILVEDVMSITKVKGIGPKTAKRLILELKDKIPQVDHHIEGKGQIIGDEHNTIVAEALSALTLLGFSKAATQKAINSTLKSESIDSVEQLVKLCLKKL